jgi:hypothetical protein
MPEYGSCECFVCYRRIPKPEAHRVTIQREKGHTGGSFRFGCRSTSYYTGRTYYARQDVWLCSDCYPTFRRQQRVQNTVALIVFLAICAGIATFVSNTEQSSGASSSSNQMIREIPTNQTANLVRIDDPRSHPNPPSNPSSKVIINAQNHLIELGYLVGPADGLWGSSRSRH